MNDKLSTVEERRLKRIEQLKARLQKETSRQNTLERKRRTGQLVAFGVGVEQWYKTSDTANREAIKALFQKLLEGRNLDRALEGFDRLSFQSTVAPSAD